MSDDGQALPALLERLRAAVAERHASGQYPPGLEADLDAHFQRIVATRRRVPGLAILRRQIEAARRASHFSPDRIPTSTKLPGGALLHKGMSRLFLRQAHGILLQVQEFADRTLEALEGAAALTESPDDHQHADLIEQIDAHSDALAALAAVVSPPVAGRGGPREPGSSMGQLERRIRRLEHAEASRRWRPWFGKNRFEAAFDDGRGEALAQAASAALGDRVPVFDLSAGPDVAHEGGGEVSSGGSGGGDGGAGDGPDGSRLAGLVACPDASLGGVVALCADEVLTAQQLVDLVALAFERLAPGGRLLISSGAPQAIDPPRPPFNPTLGPPLPARYVAFVCREAGYPTVEAEHWPEDGYLVVATR